MAVTAVFAFNMPINTALSVRFIIFPPCYLFPFHIIITGICLGAAQFLWRYIRGFVANYLLLRLMIEINC
jgi:hypothetical protein